MTKSWQTKIGLMVALPVLLMMPFTMGQTYAQTTSDSSVEIVGTCGLVFDSGNPINYGSLANAAESTEQNLEISNSGVTPANVDVKGVNWDEDGGPATNVIPVGSTQFSLTSGTYASKTPLTTVDQLLEAGLTTTTSTYWQLKADLTPTSFTGNLKQTLTFTITC